MGFCSHRAHHETSKSEGLRIEGIEENLVNGHPLAASSTNTRYASVEKLYRNGTNHVTLPLPRFCEDDCSSLRQTSLGFVIAPFGDQR